MIRGPLAGLTIVVTRPAQQAGRFVERASAAGAHCVRFPTLAIEWLTLDTAARARLTPDGYDWTIYTSTNAVEAAAAQLPRPVRTRIAAVGHATARALEAHGMRVDAVPQQRFDSEGLLALPEFADLRGRRVLILRGAGGRDLLREQLSRRGAEVVLGEVYRRLRARPTATAEAELREALETASRPIVAVTSVEVLDALLGLVPAPLQSALRNAVLLVPGARVASAAREREWAGEILVAASADDDAMLDALLQRPPAGGEAPSA